MYIFDLAKYQDNYPGMTYLNRNKIHGWKQHFIDNMLQQLGEYDPNKNINEVINDYKNDHIYTPSAIIYSNWKELVQELSISKEQINEINDTKSISKRRDILAKIFMDTEHILGYGASVQSSYSNALKHLKEIYWTSTAHDTYNETYFIWSCLGNYDLFMQKVNVTTDEGKKITMHLITKP